MNPYEDLPDEAFWKKAVGSRSMFDISDLWDPKFRIDLTSRVSTFGSCFAQHIGRALSSRGFNWLITENAPEGMRPESALEFNYGVFTARTGNIYTTSLLHQWTEWALGKKDVPDEVWEQDGRYVDPFRPVVEPGGFASVEELKASQAATVAAFRAAIRESDYFVFTLGLTESWFNSEHGYEYPMCPGTAAGEFDGDQHEFRNQQFDQILKNLRASIAMMREENPRLKFLLTVSPVPLTATKSGRHVLAATMESKSILRAVAGQLARNSRNVDYFPSYEIINSPVFRGAFFEPNQRSVNPAGVSLVMDHFFSSQEAKFGKPGAGKKRAAGQGKRAGGQRRRAGRRGQESAAGADAPHGRSADDVKCEEELLNAFGRGGPCGSA